MSTGPFSVLILDDNPTTTAGSINQLLLEDKTRDPDRFAIAKLTDPAQLEAYLDEHEVGAVLVDVDFELTGPSVTCLSAFRTLIRRGAPYCIGLSTSDHGRTLFPFAVCQLLPPAEQQVVGWAYKDEAEGRGYQQLIRTLDLLAEDRRLPAADKTPGLGPCRPSESGSGSLMRRILKGVGDVEVWRYLSMAHYDAQDLADLGSISQSSVYKYFDRYRAAISDFQSSMIDDSFHPRLSQAALHISPGVDPRQRIVEAFAQTHRRFFQAQELKQIVKENRTGRQVNGAWLRSNPLKKFGGAGREPR